MSTATLPLAQAARVPAPTHPVPSPPQPGPPATVALEKSPAPPSPEKDLFPPGSPVARLPVELDISIPVPGFRVRNLLALEPAQVVETGWGHGQDVPLAAGEVQLAWSEFEVVDALLAVRLTRLV
jgi:hypothetical protein